MTSPLLGLREELWKLKCRRNRRWPLEPAAEAPAKYSPRGASVAIPQQWAAPPQRPELFVVVTTYGRPQACAQLLESLHAALARAQLRSTFVLVLNDPSKEDYAPVLELLAQRFAGRFAFHEAAPRLGKQGFWYVYQHAFDVVAALRPQHTLFLQDDLTFDASFVRDACALWQRIEDSDKAALYLLSASDDEPAGRWIHFECEPSAQGPFLRTQWLDLQAFLVSPRFFDILDWQVFPAPASRWLRDEARSSGVGEQFTRRLFGRASIYQVEKTLVFHGAAPSLMNPQARAARPLDNR